MRYALLKIVCLFALSSPVWAQQAPLQERMSEAQFKAAGLDKLSADELARLNAFLEADAPATPMAGAADVPPPRMARERRSADLNHSRIKGTVTAWDVGTVFELENGERWEVIAGRARLYRPLTDPKVSLVPSLMGAWFLKFDEDTDVAKPKVERVR